MDEERPPDQVIFTPDFASAKRADGSEIVFTRSEAGILRCLAEKPGRIVTRNQLLDAISGEGSSKSDRNIDYVVSRIRRKLGDDPATPRFIVTRYGEGYKWLDSSRADAPLEADLVVGPLRGLDGIGTLAECARRFAGAVFDAMKRELPEGKTAVYRPDLAGPPPAGRQERVELTFFVDAHGLECILTARDSATDAIHAIARRQIDDPWNDRRRRNEAEDAARSLIAQMWRTMIARQPDSPLPVAMHDAAGLPVGNNASWAVNDQRLRRLLEENPDDPALKLFYATHLHSKYILLGWDLFLKGKATCRADEDRIEELVLSALPDVIRDPTQAIMAAKLLYFLDRGYEDLAIELAEDGLRSSTEIASCLAIVGQLRAFTGKIQEAVTSLDQAARLSSYGSEFHVYTMFMKCQTLSAAGDWPALSAARAELFKVRPATMVLEPIFADPIKPSFRARALTMALTTARARALLTQLTYVSTRLFREREMRENSIRGPLRLFVGRFGRDGVPDDLVETVPGLVESLLTRKR
ncbi:winged helix-turn-helix domain-containing protein [Palleronia sp. KMU-117]|uniref:winged helix-turn-helix domain-containing protein n=1 Tax=Palleronia sp. KMU-117 TaxID=3434108 RepID=UPI003D757DE3